MNMVIMMKYLLPWHWPLDVKGWVVAPPPLPPSEVFLSFSYRIKHQHLTFSSLARILIHVRWWSLSMVTRLWRHKQQMVNYYIWWKYMFFQLLSTTKTNLVAKIMEIAYLCVIFHFKHKIVPFLAVLAWFLILAKSKMVAKMATSFGDSTGLQQRHHP